MKSIALVLAVLLALGPSSSFLIRPSSVRVPAPTRLNVDIAEVDSTGNNVIVKKTLVKAQEDDLLGKVYRSGLLSKAQKAGVSLKNLEPFLELASKNPDLLILAESAGPDVSFIII